MKPSKNTLDLLYEFEVGGGRDYYNKYLKMFTWPSGYSGPTIGIGIDCAYYTEQELGEIFHFLPASQLDLVKKSVGKTGQAGREYTKVLRKANIMVTWEQAQNIFMKITWPKFARLTQRVFPLSDTLHEDAFGALVSLVFNRGSSLRGENRREMRAIVNLVKKRDYKGIAKQIRSMKRLWQGKGLDGLLARREREASIIEELG
jgi:GH24 family phage-related lysozyme (muramidase)